MKTEGKQVCGGRCHEEDGTEQVVQKEKTSLLVTLLSFFLIPLLLVLSLPVYLKYLND